MRIFHFVPIWWTLATWRWSLRGINACVFLQQDRMCVIRNAVTPENVWHSASSPLPLPMCTGLAVTNFSFDFLLVINFETEKPHLNVRLIFWTEGLDRHNVYGSYINNINKGSYYKLLNHKKSGLSLEVGSKPGILHSLRMVRLYQNMSELRV
jgi:hypothetical protein